MVAFVFEPIRVKDNAPGGACELRTFDDISAFVLTTARPNGSESGFPRRAGGASLMH
jgi:hypothetical protein